MITRYTGAAMGRIWSEQRRFETWLQVEVAAAEAMAEAGVIPASAAAAIRERGGFDVARIEEIEAKTRHDLRRTGCRSPCGRRNYASDPRGSPLAVAAGRRTSIPLLDPGSTTGTAWRRARLRPRRPR